MDLTGDIEYNALTAAGITGSAGGAPYTGYVIDAIDLSEIETSQYLDKRAVQDGMDAADIYLNGRVLSIDGGVFGTSRGAMFDNLVEWNRAFNPIIAYNADTAALGFLPLKYYRPTADVSTWPTSTYPNGVPLQIYARPLKPPTWSIRRADTGGVDNNGLALRVRSNLFAKDPRQYLQSQVSVNISTATATATYRGDFPTHPIITVAISAAGNSATIFTVAGGAVQIDLSGTTSGTYTINYLDKTIKDSNDALFNNLFATSVAQDFRQIQSGSTFYVSHTTGMSSVSIAYREAWA
ncbi:MAG: hypothetical protein IT345_10610 [Trueperaceae bacterium]|nr:hypothetical protein [Trueperaceae bacterium]